MRLSAKFNIFTGVPHLSTEMMPDHMRYLASYFRTRPVSHFFMLSIAGIAALAVWLGSTAIAAGGGIATGYALAFALAILAFFEHGFMAVPWQDTRMFRWAMRGAVRKRFATTRHNHNIEQKNAESDSLRQPDALAGLETARQYVQGRPHHGL